jgi:hypothetical protein
VSGKLEELLSGERLGAELENPRTAGEQILQNALGRAAPGLLGIENRIQRR